MICTWGSAQTRDLAIPVRGGLCLKNAELTQELTQSSRRGARSRLGLSGRTSNDFPCAPPRCGGAPAAVRTHPEHAPDGPDTGGHRPGPPGRAPGAGAMGSPSTTTSQHHSRGCCKRQSVFAPTSSVVNQKRIKRSFWENYSCNHENPACLRYGATNSSLLRWFSADVARNG